MLIRSRNRHPGPPTTWAHFDVHRRFSSFWGSNADMAGILIIAHAPFATALRECVAHIYGGLPARIGVIDVSPDCDPVEVRAFAHSEIERLQRRQRRDRAHRRVRRDAREYRADASPPSRRARALRRQFADAGARGLLSHDAARHARREEPRRAARRASRNSDSHARRRIPCAPAPRRAPGTADPASLGERRSRDGEGDRSPDCTHFTFLIHFSASEHHMLQQETTIVNKLGLHARASAKLTQLAGNYQCGNLDEPQWPPDQREEHHGRDDAGGGHRQPRS